MDITIRYNIAYEICHVIILNVIEKKRNIKSINNLFRCKN